MQTSPILVAGSAGSPATLCGSMLAAAGHRVQYVASVGQALQAIDGQSYPFVFGDFSLPGGGLSELQSKLPGTATVIIVAANGEVGAALKALANGAYDYLIAPVDCHRLTITVRNAWERVRLSRGAASTEVQRPRAASGTTRACSATAALLGSSATIESLRRTVTSVAGSHATVFITGEPGTGKQTCAEAIHRASPRGDKPFVAIDCATASDQQLSEQLFDDEASPLVRRSSGGTLFLKNVCALNAVLQERLLRLLHRPAKEAGGHEAFRLICSSSLDPMQELSAGRLREDLFYRLNILPIYLPPLRDRGHDAIEIAQAVLDEYDHAAGGLQLSTDAAYLLLRLNWTENIRELRRVVLDAARRELSDAITPACLLAAHAAARPDRFLVTASSAEVPTSVTAPVSVTVKLDAPLANIERQVIEAAIDMCEGSLPRAARLLQVSPSTLYRKREAWELAG